MLINSLNKIQPNPLNILCVRGLFILLFLLLVNGCSTRSGDYGPFTLIIESADGKQVDDIIVNLSLVSSGGHSKYSTYDNTQVISTGQQITFPRGYVTRTEGKSFGMNLSISHLDYEYFPSKGMTIYSNQKQQVIDLGKADIRYNGVSEKRIISRMRDHKITRAEAVLAVKRSVLFNGAHRYFLKAMRIERTDLIEKYLSLKLADLQGDDINSVEVQQFEQKIRGILTYYREYNK